MLHRDDLDVLVPKRIIAVTFWSIFMMDWPTFGVFFTAALILAVIPGPGVSYVLARTLKGGRREGILSSLGAGTAGMVHTLAAALGISAILAASATAFFIIKWLGVVYLIYLGVRTLLVRTSYEVTLDMTPQASRSAFIQGFLSEVLNPKTALFFLIFIPQFINPDGAVFVQFLFLGFITTFLTVSVDFIVAFAAAPLSTVFAKRRALQQSQKVVSGAALVGLDLYVAVER
jgi:threonine/homoserine/homoserine lactone efflux protein